MLNQLILSTLIVFFFMRFNHLNFFVIFYLYYFLYLICFDQLLSPLMVLKFMIKHSQKFQELFLEKAPKYFFIIAQNLYHLSLFLKTWHFYVFKSSHFILFIFYKIILFILRAINFLKKFNFLLRAGSIKLWLKFASYYL